tara:strand:- start:272 stop:442 length:171 start_codon:yes stop_codon:yes gene_type:complete
MKLGRNEKCICDSGKKYKKCCWLDDNKKHLIENCYDSKSYGDPYCNFILKRIKESK